MTMPQLDRPARRRDISKALAAAQHKTKGGKRATWKSAWNILSKVYTVAEHKVHMDKDRSLPFFNDPATGNAFVSATITIDDISVTRSYTVRGEDGAPLARPSGLQVARATKRCLLNCAAELGLKYSEVDLDEEMIWSFHIDGETRYGPDEIYAGLSSLLGKTMNVQQVDAVWMDNASAVLVLHRAKPELFEELRGAMIHRKELMNAA